MTIKTAAKKIEDLVLRHREPLLKAVIYSGAAGCAALALLFGPTHMVALTESPQFCALCHSSQNGDWTHSAHRRERCIDCHLPNNNVPNHYLWKSIDGGKDLFFHFSGLGDGNETELTPHGRAVLQANCIRCHEGMVSHINNARACTDCHRPLSHRRTALTLTREDNK